MFVQFIEGQVGDAAGLRRQHERWLEQLAPDADGWLGVTGGVTPDGTGFIAARFESEDAAQRNSSRPEQGEWWAETEKCFSGPVEFTDCSQVDLFLGGGSDDAGFVQVLQGRVSDADEARDLMADADSMLAEARPDVIGGYVGTQPDGSFTQVVYFTSEKEARAGESAERSEDQREFDEKMQQIMAEPPRFLDLPDAWLASA